MSARDRLSKLLQRCDLLPGKLDKRRAVLDRMTSLGRRIDEACDAFAESPQTPADEQQLRRTIRIAGAD